MSYCLEMSGICFSLNRNFAFKNVNNKQKMLSTLLNSMLLTGYQTAEKCQDKIKPRELFGWSVREIK